MADIQTNFLAWLRDAHAMEEQAVTMLTAQAQRLESYPELRARIGQHATETESQIRRLETVLARYDAGSSLLKDAARKVMASAQAFGGMFAGDEVIKGAQMGYVFENLEISSYVTLIAAARELDDMEAVDVFESILVEEQDMADWLVDNLPAVTQAFLARDAADVHAQR